MLTLIATFTFLLKISQVIALDDAVCPTTCINYFNKGILKDFPEWWLEGELTNIIQDTQLECFKLSFFAKFNKTKVYDQLDLGIIQHGIDSNEKTYEGIEFMVPSNKIECNEWLKKTKMILYRNQMNLAFRADRKRAGPNCGSCELGKILRGKFSDKYVETLLVDEIKYDSQLKTDNSDNFQRDNHNPICNDKNFCSNSDPSMFELKMVTNTPTHILQPCECFAGYEDIKHHLTPTHPTSDGWWIYHFNEKRSKIFGENYLNTAYGSGWDCDSIEFESRLDGFTGYDKCETVNGVAVTTESTFYVNRVGKVFVVTLK